MKTNLTVTKSNSLIKASYRLTLTEMRMLLFGISKLNPTWKEMPLTHTISVKEMAEFYNIDDNSFYSRLKEALCDKLFMRKIVTHLDEDNSTLERWIYKIDYHKPTQTFTYTFNPSLRDHLIDLKNRFTQYKLTDISKMNSIYSIRLYEIAICQLKASQKNSITFTKTIEELKEMWGISDKYTQYADFRKKTIDAAVPEINKYTTLVIKYDEVKDGRAVESLLFHVRNNSKTNLVEFDQFKISDKPETTMPNYEPTRAPIAKPQIINPHVSTTQFQNYATEKRMEKQEKLRNTKLPDDEIDTSTDMYRVKLTIREAQQLIDLPLFKNTEKLPKFGSAQLNVVEMEQIRLEKATKRYKELLAKGSADVQCEWEKLKEQDATITPQKRSSTRSKPAWQDEY